jgi:hypothetical protein
LKIECKASLNGLFLFALLASSAMAYEEVEDLVYIAATDRTFNAVVGGRRNCTENRHPYETINWQGAKGEVGAYLTNRRLLAVSAKSGRWRTKSLKVNEKKKEPRILLGKHLLVMLSSERFVGFGAATGGFFDVRRPIGEKVVLAEIGGRVAALITPSRAYGFSSRRTGAAEIRFSRTEHFESIKTTYNKITLQTSERLLTLESRDATWREFELK